MKKMKSLVLILVLAVSAWTLTGCGGMSEDEAKEYAQAVLDASYKGEFDSYMELTDSTEEEAREMYEGNMDATMAAVGFEEMGASQEMQEDYRQLFLDMAKLAKYSLGEVTEIEDGFEIQVTVEPGEGSLELSLSSSVMNQYGRQIKAAVLETLERLGVTDARVTVVDKGALDCTLKARVECAVFRSCGASERNIPWGGVVR